MQKLILSASSISAFKACPVRFRNAYVYGIRPIEDKESQRIGTNWHTILEVASLIPDSECPNGSVVGSCVSLCPICEGTGKVPEDIMEAVTRVLNKAYEGIEFADPTAKEIERVTLLHALAGYRWYYGEQYEPVIAREQYFSLPLLNPQTGHPVPDVFIEGKIDKLIEIANGIAVKEHKSTGRSIDPDSTYWGHLNLDVQTTMYIYAARRMQLGIEGVEWDINEPLISTVKYDVYHKPQISPKKLTQGDSKKFVKDGIIEEIETIFKERKTKIGFSVGTMIEVPRAALTADEIATEAEFFSFGTNDLTQMAMGFSRDDAGKFLGEYVNKGIYAADPFQKLDQEGVGKLVETGTKLGRKTRKKLKVGICGEHGGEPDSIDFCHRVGLNYVSCSPFRVPIARLAAAQAAVRPVR